MLSLHERAGEVLLAVLSRPDSQRDAFLVEACAGDDALLREVASLLPFHGDGGSIEVSPEAPAEDFAAGDVFAGRYRMIARVGRGGMGDVWRADDLVLRTPVALKLMRSAGPAARNRLLQEVRLARQITHPAVCRVFDAGETNDQVFFSMELVEGEDLAALLKRTGRLTSERVVEIALQLCAGLAAAHARGVLHRDLKPANVLIDQDGRVRITDFGIAVTTDDASPQANVGTLGYMAPEQFGADAALTERTDLYALGVVLYELVTGQRPGPTPVPPSQLVRGVDGALEAAILQAMSRDPRDRPASAEAMAAMTARPGARRRSRVAAAAVTVALVIAASGAWFVRRIAPALTARDTIVLTDFRNATPEP